MPEKQYFTGIDVINAPRIESLTVTEDGTYTASSDVIGYNPVVVNTNQPWQPLEDGYSNFWFELTDDTLSPWLNFSAKNNDAVIDWGDGSGEVALDTLTPTHTYAKAGKYVVKVKGVTGIAQFISDGTNPINAYTTVIKAVELNSEILNVSAYAFAYCIKLEHADISSMAGAVIGSSAFIFCTSMQSIALPSGLETISASALRFCTNLKSLDLLNTSLISIGTAGVQYCQLISVITLPSTVESLSQNSLANCISLAEVHCQATTPPTLGNNVFNALPSNWICYVPIGTGDTYKAAAGWSTYADHILEEGQTPNRAMLSRLAKAVETDTDEEMR